MTVLWIWSFKFLRGVVVKALDLVSPWSPVRILSIPSILCSIIPLCSFVQLNSIVSSDICFHFLSKNYPQKTLESPLNFSELLPVKNPQSPLMNIPLKACEKPLHSLQETLCLHLNPLRFPFKKPLISPWETFNFPLKGIFQREFKGILLGKIPLEFPLKGVSRVILRGNIVILKGFLRNTCKIYSRNT